MCKGNNSKCTWEENDFQKNVVLGILKHLQQKGAMKGVTRRDCKRGSQCY